VSKPMDRVTSMEELGGSRWNDNSFEGGVVSFHPIISPGGREGR
jgi:hypothetical protein